MKKIEAVIKPFKLDEVREALYEIGVTYDLGSGFSAAGALVGATKKDFYGDINKARVILTISKTM